LERQAEDIRKIVGQQVTDKQALVEYFRVQSGDELARRVSAVLGLKQEEPKVSLFDLFKLWRDRKKS